MTGTKMALSFRRSHLIVAALAVGLALTVGTSRSRSFASEPPVPTLGASSYSGYLPVPATDANAMHEGGHDLTRPFLATRVVNAATRAPIAGARLRHFMEDVTPFRMRYAPLLAQAHGNADGFVWLPLGAKDTVQHWVVDAPGFAPHQITGGAITETPLHRGETVRARLIDVVGAPLIHVEVEWYMGCPHAPALGTARTDANGVFEFQHVDIDEGFLWVHAPHGVAPTLGIDMSDLVARGTRLVTVVMEPGKTIRGVALDLDGKPLKGVAIRADDEARGPGALTNAQGTFELTGAVADRQLRVSDPRFPDRAVEVVEGATSEALLRLRFSRDGLVWAGGDPVTSVVSVTDVSSRGVPSVLVRVVSGEGRSWIVETDEDGHAEFELVPGSYTTTHANPFQCVSIPRQTFHVKEGAEATTTVRAATQVPFRLTRAEGVPAEFVKGARLAVKGHVIDIEEAPLFLPPLAQACVVIDDWVIPVREPKADVREAVISSRPFHKLKIDLPDVTFAQLLHPTMPHVVLASTWHKPHTLRTRVSGPCWLRVEDKKNVEYALRLDVPAGRWTESVVPKFQLPVIPEPNLARVLFGVPGQSKEDGADVLLYSDPLRIGATTLKTLGSSSFGSTSIFGAESGEEIDVPSRVKLVTPGLAVLTKMIRSAGDHTFSWGTCTLVVDVKSVGGEPLPAVVWMGNHLYRTNSEGTLELKGCHAGQVSIVVSPTTLRHAALRVPITLVKGTTTRKTVTLPLSRNAR